MPPFVPLPDGAQLEIFYHLGGKTIENRLWFVDRSPPVTQAHLDALAAGADAWVTSELLPWLGSDLEYVGVLAEKWDDHQGDLFSAIHTSVLGGNTSGTHSANVSIRVAFKGSTDQTFPNNANFVPGIPLDSVQLNEYTLAIRNRLFDAYVDVIDLAAAWGSFPAWRWVVTSRQLGHAWRTVQAYARTDFIRFPSPYVSPRRRRLPR